MVAFNTIIANDDDDGFDDGSVWKIHVNNYGGSDQFIVRERPGNYEEGGVRFQTITIPQGATINTATITLYVDSGNGVDSITAYGDDVDDAAVWSNSSRPLSGFTDTTAGTAQTTIPASGNTFTVDIVTPLQEIINRAGWVSGNSVRFRLEPSATYATTRLTDYDGGGGNEAQIDVDYDVAGGANPWYYFAQQ